MSPSESKTGGEKENQDDPLETASVGSSDSLNSLVLNDNLENEIEKRKNCKRGVVYLSFIPPSMNPTILRRLLSEYGIIERIYLQPELKKGKFSIYHVSLAIIIYSIVLGHSVSSQFLIFW